MVSPVRRSPDSVQPIRSYLADLWSRREFALFLASGNFRARNASTSLGLLWWVLNPLLLGSIYFLVFGVLFGARGPGYIGYLMTGIFVFHFTSDSIKGGANSILQNAKLIANLRFPRLVMPISTLLEAMFGFLASLLVLVVILFALDGVLPGIEVGLLFLIIPIHVAFNLGLGSLAARLAVPFRDVANLIPFVTRLWLYLSPIIWPLDRLENLNPALQRLVEVNPMFSLTSVYRAALTGSPLDWSAVGISALWAVGVGVLGVWLFVKFEDQMARYL